MVSGANSLSDVQTALRQINVDLFEANGSFRNLDDVLGEVAQQWDKLNDVQKSFERLTSGDDDAIKILIDPKK